MGGIEGFGASTVLSFDKRFKEQREDSGAKGKYGA